MRKVVFGFIVVSLLIVQQVFACDYPYFPIRDGASWTYQTTGTGIGNSDMTQTISDVTDSSFSYTTTLTDFTQTVNWQCGDEGLLQMNYASNSSGFTFETLSATGISFPPASEWQVGKEWDSSYEVKGSMVQEGVIVEVEGTVAVHQKIAAEESVTVAAGSFDTLKIDSAITMNLSSKMMGMSIPISLTVNSSSYYAKDVGMVKSLGEGYSSELTTYSIP